MKDDGSVCEKSETEVNFFFFFAMDAAKVDRRVSSSA